jgi:hypothetical protein
MPSLNWIGKDAVIRHHKEVPFRLLEADAGRSCLVEENSGNEGWTYNDNSPEISRWLDFVATLDNPPYLSLP